MNEEIKKRDAKIAKMNEMELKAALYDNAAKSEVITRQHTIDRTNQAGERKALQAALETKQGKKKS